MSISRSEVAERLAGVKLAIAETALGCGRSVGDVQLVAVSKGQPVEAVNAAMAAGHHLFGENYAQQLKAKRAALPDARWHFIGHLQRNKVPMVVPGVEMVESVDSQRLATALSRRACAHDTSLDVLLEVNLALEESKSGVGTEKAMELARFVQGLEGLELRGLMCIPPLVPDPERSRPFFRRLAALREEMQQGLGRRLEHLSMGMSHDHLVAVEEGATIVRVGTAIFGPRA